jgi:excisionase family DNA binding protein
MNTSNDSEKFLRLKDVQDRFGVSRATVWRWHTERGLRVITIGNVVRVRNSDLMEWVERHLKVGGANGKSPKN